MNPTRRTSLQWLTLGALAPLPVLAQELPPLRLIVPFNAGSGLDGMARTLGESVRLVTGRAIIVDNKPGGGTVIGTQAVAQARPDGNTVLITTGGHTTNAVLFKKLPYDSVADFTPITMIVKTRGFGLVVGANSRLKTLKDLLAAAKAEPGKVSFGSSGVGNTTHVVGELFARSAGIEMNHVAYRGTPITDVMAGTVDCMFVSPAIIMSHVQSGKLRVLGVSDTTRFPELPDVPTFGEFGIKAEVPSWMGIWGPAGLSIETTQGLQRTFAKAAHTKSFETFLKTAGGEAVDMSPVQFKAYVAAEIARYHKILPPLGIQMD